MTTTAADVLVPVDEERHRAAAAEFLPRMTVLIGAEEHEHGSDGEFEHVNAATGRVQARVPLAGADEVDRAVEAARAASAVWRGWRPDERRNVLLRLAGLIRRQTESIAQVLTLECGSPITGSRAMPGRAADYLEYYAGLADKLEGRVVPIFPEKAFDYTLPEPYGVIGVISTWNGGISSVARKAGAALAAGNTVVVKPMELAPFSSLIFGRLALEAGFPEGVVNIVPGAVAAGEALVAHPGVDKLSFTGGIDAARAILVGAARNITPVVLELGGKSGNLVFPDADLDAAGLFAGGVCMRNSGQGCVMPTRLLVHEDVHDEVLERAVRAIGAMPLGDPLDPRTQIGPVVSRPHAERILRLIREADEEEAGRRILGGGRVGDKGLRDGHFVEPTVFDGVDPRSAIARTEVFGPVLTVTAFRDEAEAVALANDTPYGLAGYVHTRDLQRAHRVAASLDAGYVSVNGFAALPAAAPFGGFRDSGYGKEGGREGIAEFLRSKNVYVPIG
ncbi:aldehyde dehydrogenase family protein [Streptodolium elevatio]|uniref:Aldehyde dehydrogenase family protein n=1 Tax=Streptodolium elevatio TaxID=3157996 RepID=A0ABV3DKK5_9ACTN